MKTLILCMAFLAISSSFAQSISPQVIGSASGSAVIEGNTHQYSIGEMVLVSTFTNPNIILTQGFLQAADSSTSSIQESLADWSVSVYPNPTQDMLQIDFGTQILGKFTTKLYDAAGKMILNSTFDNIDHATEHTLNLSELSSGGYFLYIFLEGSDDKVLFYKVQKIN